MTDIYKLLEMDFILNKYNPSQPRVPAGSKSGGQWGSTSGFSKVGGVWTKSGAAVAEQEKPTPEATVKESVKAVATTKPQPPKAEQASATTHPPGSLEDAQQKLSERGITLKSKMTGAKVPGASQEIAQQHIDMGRFEGAIMKDAMSKPIAVTMVPSGGKISGEYKPTAGAKGQATMVIEGTRPIGSTAPTLGKDNWTVGSDVGNLYRHEYGHHVFLKSVSADNNLRAEWTKISRGDGPSGKGYPLIGSEFKGDYKTKKHPISEYASTNHHELFSESFAAYTNKQYKRGSLPKDIERFMDMHISGKG